MPSLWKFMWRLTVLWGMPKCLSPFLHRPATTNTAKREMVLPWMPWDWEASACRADSRLYQGLHLFKISSKPRIEPGSDVCFHLWFFSDQFLPSRHIRPTDSMWISPRYRFWNHCCELGPYSKIYGAICRLIEHLVIMPNLVKCMICMSAKETSKAYAFMSF